MLYPDFSHPMMNNMSKPEPFPINPMMPENNSDYFDIAEFKQKISKKRKKDGPNKNQSRVPTLNQTEYFQSRQQNS